MIDAVISSSVLIAVIILIRKVFRNKLRSTVCYSLWLIAALRLMLPFELAESSVSVMNAAEDIFPISTEAVIQADRNNVPAESELYIPEGVTKAVSDRTEKEFSDKTHENISFAKILHYIRIIGTALMLIWFLAVNIRYSVMLKAKGRKLGFALPVPVYAVSGMNSPCIYGLFSPAIYVPENKTEDSESMRYIIAHELCHYRHGDLFWTILRYVLLSVYWFDPLVWAAAYLSKQDCECACDEGAIKELGEEHRFRYGKAIIDLIPLKSTEGFGVASTSMASGKRVLKQRMRFIASKPVNKAGVLVLTCVVLSLTAVSTFTSAEESAVYPTEKAVEEIPNETVDDGRVSVQTEDRNNVLHELIFFPAPEGYEPYIYMDEYSSSQNRDTYTKEEFTRFIDDAYFSAVKIGVGDRNIGINRRNETEKFDMLLRALQSSELIASDNAVSGERIAEISFYRANGGFTSALDISVYSDSGKLTAVMTGDDMNELVGIVLGGDTPTESELIRAYEDSFHFEAVIMADDIYDAVLTLTEESEHKDYPEFSSDSFSVNIAEKLIVTGSIPDDYVMCRMGEFSFAVPEDGSVNETDKTFLWQNGGADMRLSFGTHKIPDNCETINGTLCGRDCTLYISDDEMLLYFSDSDGKELCASVGYSDEREKEQIEKILGSIHIE